MPVTGLARYGKLFQNIQNPFEYLADKFTGKKKQTLNLITKPNTIHFPIHRSLYLVFKEIFLNDVYAINELVKKLPANPIIVDIGANVGFFNIILLSKIKQATVYAYEPIPANVQYFKNVISNNSSLNKNSNISIYQAAVTGLPKENLTLFMEATDDNQVVASVFENFNEHNTRKITVPCVTLTQIIEQNNLSKIDLLKIDCEGSEYDIIYNTSPALLLKAKHIALEAHDVDDKQNNFKSIKAYLEELGFQITYTPINDFCYAADCINQKS